MSEPTSFVKVNCPACRRPIAEPFGVYGAPHIVTRPHHRGPGMKPCRVAILVQPDGTVYRGEIRGDVAMEDIHGTELDDLVRATTRYFEGNAA